MKQHKEGTLNSEEIERIEEWFKIHYKLMLLDLMLYGMVTVKLNVNPNLEMELEQVDPNLVRIETPNERDQVR